MILVVTWGRYLAMVHFFQNSAASINTSSNIKFVFRFWAWLLVVVLPTHWRWSKVSEMNCDKPARWRTNNSAKQRKAKKSWVGGNLHLIAARNTAKWWWLSSAAKFPPFRPLFAAIRSTLILTLPPACVPVCLWDQTTEREWYDFTHTFSFSRSKPDSLFLGVLIYFGAGLSHLPLRVERHLIKNFHFPPKMETSPSSPRINQTRGEEKWKCGNRKSQLWKTKYKKKEREMEIRKKKIPALENKIQKERKY